MSQTAPLKTPLFQKHQELGARFAPFAGYEMPIQYTGIVDEHQAVRNAAGLFDVSHMGVAKISGPDAFAFLDHALTRDLSKLTPGKAAYTLMCLPNGGTVDDLIVYQDAPQSYFLVLNASNKAKDMAHLRSLARGRNVELLGPFDDMSLLALQGPNAEEILRKAGFAILSPVSGEKDRLPEAFSFFEARLGSQRVRMATTGYTGERGVEIFVDSRAAADLWSKLLEVGAPLGLKPVGLGARDTLRTEMGYSLYGHELLETINPIEAGLAWAVGFAKNSFVGRDALVAAKAAPRRKLIGLKNASRQAPRPGMAVFGADGARAGEITSGTFAPTLGFAIGLALVDTAVSGPYTVDIRGTRVPFETTPRTFHKKN